MYLYQLVDTAGRIDTDLFKDIEDARQTALDLMDKPAWETTTTMHILRIDTRKKLAEYVEYVIHGAYRAEAHKVEDK